MNNLSSYSMALVLQRGKFSCHNAASLLDSTSHDHLSRFLSKTTRLSSPDWKSLPSNGYLVIDDCVIDKRHSQQIEGVSHVYSSSDNKTLPGLCFVLLLWVSGGRTFVLDVIVWRKGGSSKNELLREKLKALHIAGLRPEKVLFDSWYAAYETLNLLESLGWTYFSRIKENRYFNGIPVKAHLYFGAKAVQGKLKGLGHTVQIVRHGDRYLVTNDRKQHYSGSMATEYGKRWVIEVVFREMKTVLHLEQCSARSLQAQTRHIRACLAAYYWLKKQYPKQGAQAAQSQILQLYHRDKTLCLQYLATAA